MKKSKNRRRGSKPLYEARHGVAHCRKKKLCAECGKKLRGRRTRWCSDKCITTYMIRSDPSEARRQVGFRDKGICAACALDCLELAKKVKGATLAAHDRWWEERGREEAEAVAQRVSYQIKKGRPQLAKRHQEEGSQVTRSQGPYLEAARRAALSPYGMEAFWWRKSFWDADHIVEVSQGGGECGLSNYRTLCISCHSERSSRANTERSRKRRRVKRIPRRRPEECERGGCGRSPNPCRGCRRYRARVLGG